jgi:predicted nucleic acid-binding protein
MGREVLVDSSGLYPLADHRDPSRKRAVRIVRELLRDRACFVLTDYILDESLTLAKARAGGYAALRMLEIVEQSCAFEMSWIGPDRFEQAITFFKKHSDQGYSFTDCTSFVLMKELGIRQALTTDRHFLIAGFEPLLPLAET